MTACQFLKVYYEYAARFERWRAGKPLSHAERVRLQKERDAHRGGA